MTSRLRICVFLAVLAGAIEIQAQTGGYDVRFQHPPLMYDGPDPTAGYFLPSSVPASTPSASMLALPPDADYYPSAPNESPEFLGTYPEQSITFDYPPAVEPQQLSDHKDGFFQ